MSQHGCDLILNFKLKIITKRKIITNIKLTNRKPKQTNFPEKWCGLLPKAMSFDPHGDSLQVTKFHAIPLFALIISTSTFLFFELLAC
jgi:hypothetical protein